MIQVNSVVTDISANIAQSAQIFNKIIQKKQCGVGNMSRPHGKGCRPNGRRLFAIHDEAQVDVRVIGCRVDTGTVGYTAEGGVRPKVVTTTNNAASA